MSHTFFLKFIAIIIGGGIVVLGLGVLIGDVFNPKARQLSGDPFYDGIVDLVDMFGTGPTGFGLIVLGLSLGALCYWKADH
ncbi:MAG: hypothetical protein RLN72_03480 [Henriciella sp.]